MSLYKFLSSKIFFRNIFILAVLIIVSFFLITMMLNNFTHHGESIPVPDLKGKKIDKLDALLAEHNFHYSIVDSLYDSEMPPGSVLDQDPAAKSKVKEGRMIYLTINSTQPPDVKMPDLVDVSFRQAEAMLQSFGLVTGEIIYRPDLAKNAVLEQRYRGRVIKPGAMLPKGSAIDLVLGDGLGDKQVQVPDLTGLTRSQAMARLMRSSLSLGAVNYDTKDTAGARVYLQTPSPGEESFLPAGANVDIYLE